MGRRVRRAPRADDAPRVLHARAATQPALAHKMHARAPTFKIAGHRADLPFDALFVGAGLATTQHSRTCSDCAALAGASASRASATRRGSGTVYWRASRTPATPRIAAECPWLTPLPQNVAVCPPGKTPRRGSGRARKGRVPPGADDAHRARAARGGVCLVEVPARLAVDVKAVDERQELGAARRLPRKVISARAAQNSTSSSGCGANSASSSNTGVSVCARPPAGGA